MPNTFTAIALDLTDNTSPYGSVHIRDKTTVGERTAASASFWTMSHAFPRVSHAVYHAFSSSVGNHLTCAVQCAVLRAHTDRGLEGACNMMTVL